MDFPCRDGGLQQGKFSDFRPKIVSLAGAQYCIGSFFSIPNLAFQITARRLKICLIVIFGFYGENKITSTH